MTTFAQICTRAAKSIRYLGRNETMTAQDANDALISFNAMLDSWSNETLLSYVVLERSFTLVINQGQYTIGTTGSPNINATRPLDITQAYVQDSGGNNFLLNIKPRDWWNQIGNRGATITSQIPTDLFYDPQYPLGVINIFPLPLIAYTVFYDSTQDQVDGTNLGDTISMPPGYERAYETNLAIELIASGFPAMLDDKSMATLAENARQSKANIKRTNMKEVIANYDAYITSKSYASYNIYRDSSN